MQQVFLIHSSPYQSSRTRETLDLVLVSAAFNDNIVVIFIHDGVLQLLDNQDTTATNLKNISNILNAFNFYDINQVFADQQSLTLRHIHKDQLPENINPIDQDAIKALLKNAGKVTNL